MKKILIIGASSLQVPGILKAKEMGFETAVVDFNPRAVGIKYADKYYNVSTTDKEGVYEAAKDFGADGIVTLATDMPMRSLAYACEKLNLVGVKYDTAVKATDKGEMIKAFEKYDVAHPWYHILKSGESIESIVREIHYPLIVKPTDNSGSRGVVLVHDEQELYEAVSYSIKESREGNIILEEYMIGPEVSVEVIVLDGKPHILQITDKLTTGAPHFVEMGHNQPSSHGKDIVEEIKSTTENAIKCLKVTGGPVHAELKITENGIKVVELGARLGGDHISTELVSLSTGIDLVEATINWALGEDVDIKQKISAYSAIRYVGKLSAVKMDREQMELLDYFSWNRLNENDIKSSRDREFCFIVSGETRNIVDHKIDVIRCTIENRQYMCRKRKEEV